MNAGDGLRVGGNEFGFAAFLEDGIHALNFHRFKWIRGRGIAHAVMDGGVVGDISDEERGKQNDGGFIRDGENAAHQKLNFNKM